MKSQNLFTGKSLSFGSPVKQMSFLDNASFKPKSPSNVSVTFDILVTPSSLSGNSIKCAFLKYNDAKETVANATVSTDGCTYDKTFTVGAQTYVRCKCDHLTDFFVGLTPSVNPAETSPTPSPTPSPGASAGSSSSSNAGLIAGVVVGVLAVAAAIAGVIIVRRRKTQHAAMYAPSTIEQGQVSSPTTASAAVSTAKGKKRSDDDDDDNAAGPSANARPKEESLPTYSESPTKGDEDGERKKKKKKKKRTTD
jgi:hypothetical protein